MTCSLHLCCMRRLNQVLIISTFDYFRSVPYVLYHMLVRCREAVPVLINGLQISHSCLSHSLRDPTIRQPGFELPRQQWSLLNRFSHGTGTLRCLQKEMATYRHWSVFLWQDPDDVSHCRILSPDKTEWWLISATLCGWGRCFVADQLW